MESETKRDSASDPIEKRLHGSPQVSADTLPEAAPGLEAQDESIESADEADEPRDPIEQLAEEFIERLRRGENPTVAEYTEAHGEFADEIQELFPTIAAMERLKAGKETSSAGLASLGPGQVDRLGRTFELSGRSAGEGWASSTKRSRNR